VPWDIEAGKTATEPCPVFYAGGDLRLTLEFLDGSGRVAARVEAVPPTVRPLAADAALVAVQKDLPEPDDALKARLQAALGARSVHILRMAVWEEALLASCGMADAVLMEESYLGGVRHMRSALVGYSGGYKEIAVAPFPAGADELVQPEAWRVFASEPWPAADRRRLWLWLGVFALAVAAVGALVPRRRAVAAVCAMVVLGGAATAVIWFFGEVRLARECSATVCFVNPAPCRTTIEQFVLLESRGGAEFDVAFGPALPLPLPMVESSDELFRPLCTLRYGHQDVSFTGRLPQCALQQLAAYEPSFVAKLEKVTPAELSTIARRADVCTALFVDGNRATDAAGRTQTIEAWSVEWKASADPDVAYAGRSLAWWDRARREGDKPFLLAWRRDGPQAGGQGAERRACLPTLVVYASD
jgi:hypothetical protein